MAAAEKDLPALPLDRSPGPPVEVSDSFDGAQLSYVDDLNAAPPLVPMESQGEYFASGSGTSAARMARNDPPPAPAPAPYVPPSYAPQPYAPQPYAPQAYVPPAPPPPPEPVQERTSEQPWREVRQLPYQAYRERAVQRDEARQLPYQAYRERAAQADPYPDYRYRARDYGRERAAQADQEPDYGYRGRAYGPPPSAYGARDYDYPGR
jgi:hypothetical protein